MSAARWRVIALWLVMLALAGWVVAHARYVTDLSGFLPAHPTESERLLVEQLRDGPASRLILAGIEGGDAAQRARVSRAFVGGLRGDRRFTSVGNGEPAEADRDRDFLFSHRYLLSDRSDAGHFSADGLHDAIADTLEDLGSPAGLLLKSLLPRDPTGEMLHLVDGLARSAGPASRDGVWVSADGSRALIVAQTSAPGSDLDAQQAAVATLREVFGHAAGADPQLRLLLSGPPLFAVAARARIERAAMRLSIVSSILVVTLLFAVYRSAAALALGMAPVATGALVGIATVALGFGVVFGTTLGFGITLIGESVDYSIYFFVSSRSGLDWSRAWWPTVRLGMLASVCGFASLLPSGFPGLAELGAYSIGGLIAAAAVTRFVLPALLPRGFSIRDVTPLGMAIARVAAPARRLSAPATAAAAAVIAAAALAVIVGHRHSLWSRELSALSPISVEDQRLDARLRGDLGAADVRAIVLVRGDSLEAALAGAERAGAALEPLVDAKTIAGFDSPATYLPSLELQQKRRASLPDPAELELRLARATAGLGLRPGTLQPFLDDVRQARSAPLLTAGDLAGTSLRSGFDALVLHERDGWNALLPLHPAAAGADIDTAAVAAALSRARIADGRVLDLKAESDALYQRYLNEAIRLSLAGLASLVALLFVALRSAARVARALAPLFLAVACVAAGLALAGVELTMLHLVGMLLIVAVGSNYTLFFDRQSRASDGEPLTLASLAIANASTVIGFGLLAFSQVPVLTALGSTVAPGALLALIFAVWLHRG